MKPPIKRALTALILMIAVALLILWLSRPGSSMTQSHLVFSPKTFSHPLGAEIAFQDFIREDQGDVFNTESVNSLYESSPWIGRIRLNGSSRHALFSMDDFKTVIPLNQPLKPVQALTFTIFNPEKSTLEYRVSLVHNGKADILFERRFEKRSLLNRRIPLSIPRAEKSEIVFETRGSGPGAWINPILTHEKKDPRIVIMIVLDTLRYDHTSLYGYKRQTTPRLDRLSRDSQTFSRAYSTSSWTLPAHVSLFSGRDMSEHGVFGPQDMIPDSLPLISELFQKEGFLTAAFTGGGFVEDVFGFYRGFQLYTNGTGKVFDLDSAGRVFERARRFMDRHWGNDLFLFLHTYQNHAPYKAPPQWIRRINPDLDTNLQGIKNFIHGNGEYYSSIPEADRQTLIDLYDTSILYADQALVGGIVDFLKGKGAYQDALIAVLSDHGEEFYDHKSWEHGHTLYSELVRIPLVIKFPGNRKTGRVSSLTSIADIPGILAAEFGFKGGETLFPGPVSSADRVLRLLFPVSPIIPHFSAKISLVDNSHQFIFNYQQTETPPYFNPPAPPAAKIELFALDDMNQSVNTAAKRGPVVAAFLRHLKQLQADLKSVNRQGSKLQEEIRKKLQSLGYLGK